MYDITVSHPKCSPVPGKGPPREKPTRGKWRRGGTAVTAAWALPWVRGAEGGGPGVTEDSGKEKGRGSNHFRTKNFLSLPSFRALTDYVYFESPEVINKGCRFMKEYCVSVIKTILLKLFSVSPRYNH